MTSVYDNVKQGGLASPDPLQPDDPHAWVKAGINKVYEHAKQKALEHAVETYGVPAAAAAVTQAGRVFGAGTGGGGDQPDVPALDEEGFLDDAFNDRIGGPGGVDEAPTLEDLAGRTPSRTQPDLTAEEKKDLWERWGEEGAYKEDLEDGLLEDLADQKLEDVDLLDLESFLDGGEATPELEALLEGAATEVEASSALGPEAAAVAFMSFLVVSLWMQSLSAPADDSIVDIPPDQRQAYIDAYLRSVQDTTLPDGSVEVNMTTNTAYDPIIQKGKHLFLAQELRKKQVARMPIVNRVLRRLKENVLPGTAYTAVNYVDPFGDDSPRSGPYMVGGAAPGDDPMQYPELDNRREFGIADQELAQWQYDQIFNSAQFKEEMQEMYPDYHRSEYNMETKTWTRKDIPYTPSKVDVFDYYHRHRAEIWAWNAKLAGIGPGQGPEPGPEPGPEQGPEQGPADGPTDGPAEDPLAPIKEPILRDLVKASLRARPLKPPEPKFDLKLAIRCAELSIASYRRPGFRNLIGFVDSYRFHEDQASDVHLLVVQDGPLRIAAFRGTDSATNILTDADVRRFGLGGYFPGMIRGTVHAGFFNATLSLMRYITPGTIVCGHSLGGACAEVAMGMMREMRPSTRCYTFGAPRVWSIESMDEYNRKVGQRHYRVEQPYDPVTKVPALSFHGGVLYKLGESKIEHTEDPSEAEAIYKYLQSSESVGSLLGQLARNHYSSVYLDKLRDLHKAQGQKNRVFVADKFDLL